jgi:predicted transcriptional regulator
MATAKSFREHVRAELDRLELSISALAREASIPQPALSAWLSGRKDITVTSLERILRALERVPEA